MNKQPEGGQDSLTAVAVWHELVSVAATELRLLQRFVSAVECHQETKEGATVCGHWKFPSTFIPLLTHTHTPIHTGAQASILEIVLHKQHAILSVTCTTSYSNKKSDIRDTIPMSSYYTKAIIIIKL